MITRADLDSEALRPDAPLGRNDARDQERLCPARHPRADRGRRADHAARAARQAVGARSGQAEHGRRQLDRRLHVRGARRRQGGAVRCGRRSLRQAGRRGAGRAAGEPRQHQRCLPHPRPRRSHRGRQRPARRQDPHGRRRSGAVRRQGPARGAAPQAARQGHELPGGHGDRSADRRHHHRRRRRQEGQGVPGRRAHAGQLRVPLRRRAVRRRRDGVQAGAAGSRR